MYLFYLKKKKNHFILKLIYNFINWVKILLFKEDQ